jgi:G:T-mismatch repair DNA endonuclease (very short patch repair protein)
MDRIKKEIKLEIIELFNQHKSIDEISKKVNFSNYQIKRILTRLQVDYKEKKYCIICHEEIKSQGKKFCSRKCYDIGRVGEKHTEEWCNNIAKSLTGKKQPQKGNLISNARKVGYIKSYGSFSEEEMSIIEKYFKAGFTSNFKAIMRNEFPNRHISLLQHYVKTNKEWYSNFKIVKCNPPEIDSMRLYEWEQFKIDCISGKYSLNELYKKYNMLERKIINACKRNNIDLKYVPNKVNVKQTQIEKMVFDYLKNNNINFKSEVYVNKFLAKTNKYKYRFRIDFIINDNIAIEVNGDYWHSNPRVYHDINKLNPLQKRNIENDIKKKKYLLENNYRLYIIWEKDLYTNLQLALNNLKNFINSDKIFEESYIL